MHKNKINKIKDNIPGVRGNSILNFKSKLRLKLTKMHFESC